MTAERLTRRAEMVLHLVVFLPAALLVSAVMGVVMAWEDIAEEWRKEWHQS